MKPIKLPFKIGEHYENWEFDLEILNNERKKGYDSYLYLKSIKCYGFHSNYTELIFLFDVLEHVILKISFNTEEQLKQFTLRLPNTKIKWRISGLSITMTYGNISDQSTLFIMLGV